MTSPARVTSEEEKRHFAQLASSIGRSEAARQAGVIPATITQWRRQFGIAKPRNKPPEYTDEEKRRFAQLAVESGNRTAAAQAGVTPKRIGAWRKKFKLSAYATLEQRRKSLTSPRKSVWNKLRKRPEFILPR